MYDRYENRLSTGSAVDWSRHKILTRGYVLLFLLGVSTAPTVLLSRPTTLTSTRTTRLPPRCNSSIYVVLPGSWDITGGNEGGVSLGLRPKEGVFENVSVLVDVRLLRAKQLVGPGRRRL